MTTPTLIDARGHRCPTPTLKLQKAMRSAAPGTRLTLLADDPMARIDAPHLAAQMGARVIDVVQAAKWLEIIVETPGGSPD